MKLKYIFKILKESLFLFLKNPFFILPSIFLWITLLVLSYVSVRINNFLIKTFGTEISQFLKISLYGGWLVIFSLISLGIMAFVFSGMIYGAKNLFKNKFHPKDFFYGSKKFWFKNWIIMIFILLVSILVEQTAHYISLFLGRFLNLDINSATLLFIFVYFLFLAGVLLFLTLTSFSLVLWNLKVFESIKKSISLVRKNYVEVLTLSVSLFVLLALLSRIPGIYGEFVEYVIVLPLLALIGTRFTKFFGEGR